MPILDHATFIDRLKGNSIEPPSFKALIRI